MKTRLLRDERGFTLTEMLVVIRTSGNVKPVSSFQVLRFRSPFASMHRLSARHAQDFNYLRGLPDQISQILN
ncbi:MAG: prepilin-type N-terminal cleavage/methylation domain-containing protein [Rubrobacter sp.]|nr:prepilin-type N-terminal cleavage/methylation domain-containing protein [Rubrobacter sp.]